MAYEKSSREGRPEGKIKVIKILDALNRHGAKYIVIGGWAVILHGFTRTTMDLDIMVEPSKENLLKIIKALREFSEDESLDGLEKLEPTQYEVTKIVLKDLDLEIDLIRNMGEIDYLKAIEDAQVVDFNGIKVKIAGLDKLIEMIKSKRLLRPKDQMDLLFLKGKKEFLEKQGEL